MFGEGFKYQEYQPVDILPNGEYVAKIEAVKDGSFSNGNVFLELVVSIKGKPNANPNRITLTDRPKMGTIKANGNPVTEEDCNKWDNKMSRFFDSFEIKDRDFKNCSSWRGHVGTVRCAEQYDKNEPDKKSKKFKELTPCLPSTLKKAAEVSSVNIPTHIQQVAKAVGGTVEQITPENFQEDIF